jgi:hypothetical protein
MVFVYALIIWASLGTISASVHMFFVWRSLSGREGAESVVITRTHAARAGGTRRWSRSTLPMTCSCPGSRLAAS